jgi:hypothetical protein
MKTADRTPMPEIVTVPERKAREAERRRAAAREVMAASLRRRAAGGSMCSDRILDRMVILP